MREEKDKELIKLREQADVANPKLKEEKDRLVEEKEAKLRRIREDCDRVAINRL